MVSIVRSVREGNVFKFLCAVDGEEKWLSREEVGEEAYQLYRRECKRMSKRRERERVKLARLHSQPEPEQQPQPEPEPAAASAASAAPPTAAADSSPHTPICSVCMDEGANTVCLPCAHVFCCRCVGGLENCPLCSRRVEAAVKFILP